MDRHDQSLVGVATLLGSGRFREALELAQAAVLERPHDPGAWTALAACHYASRRPEDAIAVADAGLRRVGADARLLNAKARALQAISRVDDAQAAWRQALALDPGCAEARIGLALQALERGEWADAEASAPAGADGPDWTWIRARAALGRGDAPAAARLAARVAATPGLAREPRAEAQLLLGEALDRQGRCAAAFKAVSDAKAALRAHYAPIAARGREPEATRLRRIAAWFRQADPTPWRSPPPPAADGPARGHAFVLGFPRSGTTLLEQALAGHPDAVALEEAPTLAEAETELLGSSSALERLARLGAAEADHWRAVYWAAVARGGADVHGRVFVDKAPAGLAYLPLIGRLFPAAKVLFAVRDPRDVVLSCFRSSFQMNALTYAFTDLAATAACYDAAMDLAAICRALLPVAVRETRLETLATRFEDELAGVADFLGLAYTPAMADVAATAARRSVRTPSASQVRAGVNQEGVGRWRAYAAELAPVTPVLNRWIRAFGYDAGDGSG